MEHGNLLGTLVYEKKIVSYDVGNRPFAIIEVLDFLDGSFASQAEIVATGKKVAISRPEKSYLEALRAIYPLIEEEIKDDEWVKGVQRSESKS
ncbi:hypothetical protein CNQ87_10625 [Lysinibacillus fusiformis]|uniref:hypothetical protein n=1 Tax=Lysinibacillus fusiformis TaxID=28031 RepID=UPI000BBAD4AF|nr:hypothetical protein [Lysinibacillus fusiformis]PCD84787.1 hypothetical protein CNQ87_10625 [Lysinibacillus fusiformis]